jgi:hypothetical protein
MTNGQDLPIAGLPPFLTAKGRAAPPPPYFYIHLSKSRPQIQIIVYTVKNGYRFPRPTLGCHSANSPWPGIIKLFPARESLISDIPAGDVKDDNLFLQCSQEPYGNIESRPLRLVFKSLKGPEERYGFFQQLFCVLRNSGSFLGLEIHVKGYA